MSDKAGMSQDRAHLVLETAHHLPIVVGLQEVVIVKLIKTNNLLVENHF